MEMKKRLIICGAILTALLSNAQVGIGTATPAATLDIVADAATTTVVDGIIAPRLSLAALVAKSAVYGAGQEGTIVYIDDATGATNAATALISSTGYYYFDGAIWQTFTLDGEQSIWTNNGTNNRFELTSTTAGVGRGTANAFHIEDGGDVGIGVLNPTQKLSVGGNINTTGNLELGQLGTGARVAIIDLHASDVTTPGFADYHTRLIRSAGENGDLSLSNRGTGDIIIDVLEVDTGGPSLSINGVNGFVGINKPLATGPTQVLDVNGNGLFQNSLFVTGVPSNGELGLRIHKGAGTTAFFDVNSNAATIVGASAAFRWRGDNVTGTTTLMTLAYNGNLTNQGGLSTGGNLELHQQGTTNRASFIDFHSSATAGDFNARILKNPTADGNMAILNSGTGDIRMDVTGSGQAGISVVVDGNDGFVGVNQLNPSEWLHVNGNGLFSGDVTANGTLLTSDRRLKKNIIPVENGLTTIQQLNPVFYSKKASIDATNYDTQEYGFIAQELQKILPEIVQQTNREDQVLAVNYTSLIPILTKAIQEQQQQLDAKTTENNQLQERISTLEQEIAVIKKMLKM